MTTYKEFHINRYLSLRLEREPRAEKKTTIYVAGQPFIQCKFLLLNIPITEITSFDEIESIDEAAEKVDGVVENVIRNIEIPPEVEFWGHCSNLQVWYEHDYDTRLLHSNLAFSLLGKLGEVGDPLAKKVFKSELLTRYESGTDRTREFIERSGALKYFTIEERLNLLVDTEDLIALTELAEEVWTNSDPNIIIQAFLAEGDAKLENRKVVKLDFSGLDLELEEFPEAILNLKNLKILYLGSSYIKEIPDEINRLCSLKELIVSGNEISQLPDSLFELTSLKKLWIDGNKISHLPDSICETTALEELWLDGNKISHLPEKIGDLITLRTIGLESNEIKELPESLYDLKSLKKLSLGNNNLEYLSELFCNLISLKWLDLSNNNLRKLPECIISLQSLEYLDVSKNPLTESSELMEKIKKSNIKIRI